MKFSFSTIGCPDWMLNEVLAAANDFGYDGVEIRGLGADLFLPKAQCNGEKRLATSLREIADSGLEISCLSSDASCLLSLPFDAVTDNIRAYIDLCVTVGTDKVRLLAEEWGAPSEYIDKKLVYNNLCKVVPYAEEKGITLMVETCGIYADSHVMRKLIQSIGSPNVKVLWDIHHPFTYWNERPSETVDNLGEYIVHVHVKDSIMVSGRPVYKMLGYGNIPVQECIDELKSSGFDGYLSLEWMKRWNDELEAPGIVFAHYIKKIKKYL